MTGPGASSLRALGRELGIDAPGLRGTTIRLRGSAGDVAIAERVISELVELVEDGRDFTESDVIRARGHSERTRMYLRDLLGDVVLVASDSRIITPKGVAQQRYIRPCASTTSSSGSAPRDG